jgi:hypothetical protein
MRQHWPSPTSKFLTHILCSIYLQKILAKGPNFKAIEVEEHITESAGDKRSRPKPKPAYEGSGEASNKKQKRR